MTVRFMLKVDVADVSTSQVTTEITVQKIDFV